MGGRGAVGGFGPNRTSGVASPGRVMAHNARVGGGGFGKGVARTAGYGQPKISSTPVAKMSNAKLSRERDGLRAVRWRAGLNLATSKATAARIDAINAEMGRREAGG